MFKPVEDEIDDIIIRGLDDNFELPRYGVKDVEISIIDIEHLEPNPEEDESI